jgi:hypothetical protein
MRLPPDTPLQHNALRTSSVMESHKASEHSLGEVSQARKSDVNLRGAWLIAARATWMMIALACLVMFFASIPAYVTTLHQVCSGSADTVNMCNHNNQLLQTNIQALAQSHISLDGYATFVVIIDLISSLTFLFIGALIFWRKSNERFALFVSLILILFGALGPDELNRTILLITQYPAWQVALPVKLFQLSIYPALGLFFYLFPTGRLVPRWSWVFFCAWIAQVLFYELPVNSPYSLQNVSPFLQLTIFLLTYGSAVGCQIYRYRWVSGPVQRQQTKWLIFGFIGTIVLKILSSAPVDPNTLNPPLLLFGVLSSYLPWLPLPLAVGIALLRYRLWDIDTLLNRTLVYGLLTLLLALGYLGLVFGGQALLTGLIGHTNDIVIMGSTLIMALLFQPLRRGIQNVIDRRFYRRKYDAARTLEAFSATLRQEVDLATLSEHLVGVVQETMQPASVSLWLRPPARQQGPWRATPSVHSESEARGER